MPVWLIHVGMVMAKRSPSRKFTAWPLNIIQAMLSLLLSLFLGALLLGVLGLGLYMLYLDAIIRAEFDEKRWAMPVKVYARPLELYESMALSANAFNRELKLLHYHDVNCPEPPSTKKGKRTFKRRSKSSSKSCPPPQGGSKTPDRPGSYARQGDTFELMTRDFMFGDGAEHARKVRVVFAGNILVEMTSLDEDDTPGLLRLDPPEIAGIYPSHYEDRVLLKGKDLPPVLVDALLTVEDRAFFEHIGVNPKGIFRALLANLRAGRTVQGGSTLTQQLVKNMFLSNERTLKRKINEVLMAVLIDARYGKDDILEAYVNAIYLGQDGSRAIHGFGLASHFYFGVPLEDLDLHQLALLVGIVKGPSTYDPRRHQEKARERRALVLDIMAEQNLISAEDAATGKKMPLDLTSETDSDVIAYPAFIDLVRRQLRQYYKADDLLTEGLRVFTTLDPRVQASAEQTMVKSLPALERRKRKARPLQGASVVVNTQNGEVLALVGDRKPKRFGFNRALDTQRQAGSVVKPVTYLTALEHPERYTLATMVKDSRLVYTADGGRPWKPLNYDKRFHGRVMLRSALARSYNIPAVRVGLDMEVINVVEMFHRLGFDQEMRPYPSLLLGALNTSPFDIAQVYATLASGGFRIPLRAIREVTDSGGKPLQHYALDIVQVVEPGPIYLIVNAMQQVVKSGTAKSARRKLGANLNLAGKTGTTDDYRDSWFAGFSGNRLAVVWLGRDDNKPTGLTGTTGALQVWVNLMKRLHLEPLEMAIPADIENFRIDPRSGLRVSNRCRSGQTVPFLIGSEPTRVVACGARASGKKSSNRKAGAGQSRARKARQVSTRKPAEPEVSNFFKPLME